MNLPNANNAQVERKKITEYLLCQSHPDGRNKAIFFSQFGFTLDNWELLAESLRKLGVSHNVTKVVESDFGTRYSVDGVLETPDGRNPYVRTVWIIAKHSTKPRLVTAHSQ